MYVFENRCTRKDKEKQLNIAKGIVKKVLLKFYFYWTAYRNSGRYGYKWASDILLNYSKLFIDLYVEVYEILPERSTNEVRNIATKIREVQFVPLSE